jgi:hypothetical protein
MANWDYGRGILGIVYFFFLMIPLSLLGIWKLVEIIIWLFKNVHIIIGG